jgi:hypothetical protein
MPKIIAYEVTNRRTGKTTRYASGMRARNAADRQDNAYGAICCTTRAVWSDQAS